MLATLVDVKTKKFSVKDRIRDDKDFVKETVVVLCKLNCLYSLNLLTEVMSKRSWCKLLFEMPQLTLSKIKIVQISDFENIYWEEVMNGKQMASSYLIRKGKLKIPSNM
jgi:hypothetical protein